MTKELNCVRLYKPLYNGKIKTNKGQQQERKFIRLSLPTKFNDNDLIDLSEYISSNVDSVVYSFVVTRTDYGVLTAHFEGSELVIESHFDGEIKITATSATDATVKDEASVIIACEEISGYDYSVGEISINGGVNAGRNDTSANLTFEGIKTPKYYSGKTGAPVTTTENETVYFDANTSFVDVTRSGSILWNGCTIQWQLTQNRKPHIVSDMVSSCKDSDTITLSDYVTSNIEIGYSVEQGTIDYGTYSASISNGVLSFGSHFDGDVVLKIYSVDEPSVCEECYIHVSCDDISATSYSVSNIVTNGNEKVSANTTSAKVTFDSVKTTTYASGRTGTDDSVQNEHTVNFEENTESEDVVRTGSFVWNGVSVNWSVTQAALEASVSQDALDLIEYYGVERTDEQVAAVDTFLSELKAHSAYSSMQYIILPILAPQSDRTAIETEIANQTDKDTSQYAEMQKAFRNIVSGTTFSMNIRSWFIGKNGVRLYKKNAGGRTYILFNENIEFDTANISGGICTTIAGKSSVMDNCIQQTRCMLRVNGTSWVTRENISFQDSSLPKMYASSVSGKSVKASLNGAGSNAIADISYADGATTTYTTNRFLRINSSSTSDGISTSFDDPNGIAISAAFLCKDYAMTQEELNSITNIFRKLILAFWED